MTRQGIGRRCLLVAAAGGLLLAAAGCGGSSKATTTTTTPVAPTTTTGPFPSPPPPPPAPSTGSVPAPPAPPPTPTNGSTSHSACTTNCVVSSDNVQYHVTGVRRFKDRFNQEVVAIGFTITNHSSQGADFAPLNGGFSAVTSAGSVVDETDYIGQAAGDPRCYDSSLIDTNGTDAQTYHVNAGATFRLPKQMCMVVPAGQKVTEIEFADDNATGNADVTLKPAA